MKALKLFISLFFLLNIQSDCVSAQKIENIQLVTLDECISIALKNNRELQKQQLSIKISKNKIDIYKSDFDVTLNASANFDQYDYFTGNTDTDSSTLKETGYSFQTGIEKSVKTGGSFSFGLQSDIANVNYSDYFDPSYANGFYFRFSHSLLKGSGLSANTKNIKASKNSLKIENVNLRKLSNNVIAETHNAYWNLGLTYKNYEIIEKLIKHTKDQYKQLEDLISLGVRSKSELVLLDERIAFLEKSLVDAKKNIYQSINNLKTVLGTENLEINYKPSDKPLDHIPELASLDFLKEKARDNNFDLAKQKLAIENLNLDLKYYKNKSLPELSLNSGVNITGENNSFSSSFKNFGKTKEYYVGLSFGFPFASRKAKANHNIAFAKLQKAQIELGNFEQRLFINLKNTYEEVLANEKKHQLSDRILNYSTQKLKQEEEKFKLGKSSLKYIVDFEKDLESSSLAAFASLIDLIKSHVKLQKIAGILWKG